MKNLKTFILFFLVIINITNLPGQVFFAADNPNIQYYGRWDNSDPKAPTHSWPGVYIYTEFTGTNISVKLNDYFCYYNVYIDGELHSVFHNSETGDITKTLASGLEDTTHTLLFTKRNETSWAKFTFLGFELNDGETLIEPKAKAELKIEFIGDSFTSASGNGAPTNDVPENLESYTDIDKGFGPIVARNYGAQYHMSSMSGIGLVLDWQGDRSFNMPDHFDRTLAYNSTPKWDFERWVPNLVVIGLGLNDYSGYGGWEDNIEDSETEEYIATYHEFITTIRDYYPGVRILAVAPHVEWIRNCVKKVVNTENNAGHNDIFYAQYSYYNGGYVNNGHPSIDSHAKIAQELIAAIDTIDAFSAYVDTIPPAFENLPTIPFTSYEKKVELQLTTDTYATVKYSTEDKAWSEMEYTFDETGKRAHTTQFIGEHGKEYTLFVRAADNAGNQMENSTEINFSIDTTKVLLNWYDLKYNDGVWVEDSAGFGFGTNKTINTEIDASKTTYFRKNFQIEDKDSFQGFGFLIQGIGGSIVYLNGLEVSRINLSEDDEIVYDSQSTSNSYYQKVVTIDTNNGYDKVINGENTIAVEIHATGDNFSESFFNAQMFNDKNQIVFPLSSQWLYYSEQQTPEQQIINRSELAIDDNEIKLATDISLNQNYPNPFNCSTIIKYSVNKPSKVNLAIYNLRGELQDNLVNEFKSAGIYSFHYTSHLPSGIYFYRLSNENSSIQRKMLLLK